MNSLAQTTLRSPLLESLTLGFRKSSKRKSPVAAITLTSLVDAFTIVVIYLLVNSTASEQIDIKDEIHLPQASFAMEADVSPIVVFKNNQFYIEDQVVPENQLQARLQILKEQNKGSILSKNEAAIIVQADEKIDFDKLQPLIVASSYAGIQKVKFAVLQKD